MYGCRQKFLVKKGAVNHKRMRNTALKHVSKFSLLKYFKATYINSPEVLQMAESDY